MRLPKLHLDFKPLRRFLHRSPGQAALDTPSFESTSPAAAPCKSDLDTTSPTKSYKTKAPKIPPLEECPICHDPVGIPNPEHVVETWTKLHCGHRFGSVCIQTWLEDSVERESHITPCCPMCRSNAKHPECGHLVFTPDLEQYLQAQYQLRVPYDYRSTTLQRGGRERRRLQRREGHPLRPPPPPKPKPDTLGDCRTCADKAAREERRKRIAEQIQAQRGAANNTPVPRRGIKSILPPQIRARALSPSYSGRQARDPAAAMDLDERRARVRTVFCDGGEIIRVPRSPTPAPVVVSARRLSI